MKVKFVDEFKTFVARGNVVDMAIGLIIGAAFGTVVSSLVADILMPPIGLLVGGVDFTGFSISLNEHVKLEYGKFLQAVFNFLLTAFAVFMVIKVMNRLRAGIDAKKAAEPKPEPVPTKEEVLLTEIRDLLKSNQAK